jgi:hypothetical protein
LKLFFENTVGFANEKLKNRILSQFNWNHSIHSDHVEAQIYDGLNLAARKDLAYERYGTELRALYVDNTDEHLAELEARDLAVHVEKLAVCKGTTLIYENQMTDSVFFIAKGKFVDETGQVLHTGAYIVPKTESRRTLSPAKSSVGLMLFLRKNLIVTTVDGEATLITPELKTRNLTKKLLMKRNF